MEDSYDKFYRRSLANHYAKIDENIEKTKTVMVSRKEVEDYKYKLIGDLEGLLRILGFLYPNQKQILKDAIEYIRDR